MSPKPRRVTATAAASVIGRCTASVRRDQHTALSAVSQVSVLASAWRAPTLLPGDDAFPSDLTFPDEEIPRA